MDLSRALAVTLESIPDARLGLPVEVFHAISCLTPLVNVDLLVRQDPAVDSSSVLLTWRDDDFYTGWHVPGGVIRFKESWQTRLEAVASTELGAHISSDPTMLGVFEMMAHSRDVRGHFISLLFKCELMTPPDEARRCQNLFAPRAGEWSWFEDPPLDLLVQQDVYRPFWGVGQA